MCERFYGRGVFVTPPFCEHSPKKSVENRVKVHYCKGNAYSYCFGDVAVRKYVCIITCPPRYRKNDILKPLYTLTVFEILLVEGRSKFSHSPSRTGIGRVKLPLKIPKKTFGFCRKYLKSDLVANLRDFE